MKENYKIIKKIGQGSFGCVYYSKVKGTNYDVAIKTINIKNAKKNHMSVDQIVNECKILNTIKSPFVMKLVE